MRILYRSTFNTNNCPLLIKKRLSFYQFVQSGVLLNKNRNINDSLHQVLQVTKPHKHSRKTEVLLLRASFAFYEFCPVNTEVVNSITP